MPADIWSRRRAIAALAIVAPLLGAWAATAEEFGFLGSPPWLTTPKSWEVVLAPPDEPGGRFVMEGRLLGLDGKTGLPGVKMFIYHADRNGLYARESRHYMRLAGVLATDAEGRYRIISVLPGQYGGPPHVHFEAWGAGLPLHLWYVNLYRGPEEKADSLWGRMGVHLGPLRTGQEQFFPGHPDPPEVNVKRIANGIFFARCDLYWNRGYEATAHQDSVRRGLARP